MGGVCPFTHQGSLVHGQELWAGSQKLGVLILILQCCFASTCLSEHICPNGREMTGRVLVQNREKYSANPREEQEVAAERAARSLPVAIQLLVLGHPRPAPTPANRLSCETTSAPQALSPRRGPSTAAGNGALWQPPEPWAFPCHGGGAVEGAGSLQYQLHQVGGVVGVGAATNAPSPTPQASHLATCFWQLASSCAPA